MNINKNDTAVVITDPQNDVLSEMGIAWDLVGESIKENKTIENLEQLLKAAKQYGFEVFISPHYYYPTDYTRKFGGPIEQMMKDTKMFARKSALNLDGFVGSGADWLDKLAPMINDGKTIVTSPHKVFGPETNDLVDQLRKRKITKVILGGMLANLCVESHLRELVEQGFEVAVVKDATAAPRHPQLGDGYQSALINFGFVANAVFTTQDILMAMTESISHPVGAA